MTPDFQIIADDKDITEAIRDRMISLTLTDAAGQDSDTFDLTLDDRDGIIKLPKTGALLQVSIGYKETGLHLMGKYKVDEIALSGPPNDMKIRGRAADFVKKLKQTKTRPWDNITIGEIVATIAAEHGYTPRCEATLAAEVIPHIDQSDESDLHFLTRLALVRGATSKPAGGCLIFGPAGEAKSATGKSLPSVTLTAGQISRHDAILSERSSYTGATARYYDVNQAKEVSVTAGSGEQAFSVGMRCASKAEAERAAEARRAALERGAGKLRLTCDGDPALMAEGHLTVTGIRTGVDGTWRIKQVTHKIDNSGYICDIDAETGAAK